ncbi:MAG: methylated-DNA--[protein]-cysteine S-methyltransferase [Myxococcales bacterium]|nr:methylated-DNA--[protein]-cysteine S-methyltransferase [Myxococcales bacterium]
MTYVDYLNSPLGLVQLEASDKGVTRVIFCERSSKEIRVSALTHECKYQLNAYFMGQLQQFQLPLDWVGTSFQQQVWSALMEIHYGQTRTYLDVARQLHNPQAVRAVGGANARNPISLIVPCHRVIGTQGRLTGYAGGLTRKQWLLEHEGALLPFNTHAIGSADSGG